MNKQMISALIFVFVFVLSFCSNAGVLNIYFDETKLFKTPENRYGIGFIGGTNRFNGDFHLEGNGGQIALQFNVVPLRFLHVNLDYGVGVLQTRVLQVHDDYDNIYAVKSKGQLSQFTSVVRVLPARIWMYDQAVKWAEFYSYFYVGMGYAKLVSDVTATPIAQPIFGYKPDAKVRASAIVYEFGCDLPLFKDKETGKQNLFLNIALRHYATNSDLLDGFVPEISSNRYNDVYNTYNIGLTYKF